MSYMSMVKACLKCFGRLSLVVGLMTIEITAQKISKSGSNTSDSGRELPAVMDYMPIWIAFFLIWVVLQDIKTRLIRTHPPKASNMSVRLSYGRRMFTTKGRYLALGPEYVKKGDCLAFLKGGRVPYVLRPQGDSYEIVGDCYLHGEMRGERASLRQDVTKYGLYEFYRDSCCAYSSFIVVVTFLHLLITS
jgi:hypothetical protein